MGTKKRRTHSWYVRIKGHHITLQALIDIPELKLIIIGQGEEKKKLVSYINAHKLNNRVQFINYVDQKKLGELYAAAMATILMSSMEGMPNVILESLATGTPVISTNVGGVPEIVNNQNGILLTERSSYSLINAINEISKWKRSRTEISDTVKRYNWSDVAKLQLKLYTDIIGK